MAGIPIKPYPLPKELTNADWQKAKGVLGKTKKTGIGDLLKKGEALHSKIDFMKLDPGANAPKTKADLDKAKAASLDHYKSAIVPLMTQLDAIQKQAEKVAKENSKLLKGNKNGAETIAETAGRYRVTLKSLDLDGAIKAAEARIDKLNGLAAKMLGDSLKKFIIGSKAFLGDPTVESWESNIKQQGRSVSNSVRQLDSYNKEFWSDFSKFQGFDIDTLKLPRDESFSKKSVPLVKAAQGQVVKIAQFKG